MPHIPRPFSRPKINLSGAGTTKAWSDVTADKISDGDLVQWRGVVKSVTTVGKEILVVFANGTMEHYRTKDVIHAFTAT